MKSIPLPVNELKAALPGLGKIISRRTTLPVLGYVQVERTQLGSITLTANNLDQAAVVSLDSDGKGEACSILVPLKDLSEVVKRCGKNDTITVAADDSASIIKYPVGTTMAEHRFDLIPAEEFPPVPQMQGEPLPLTDGLKRSLLEAFQCASDDTTRYVLNGAFIDVSEPKCHQVVGTNGRIMYSSNSFSLPLEKSLIVPTNRFLQWKPFTEDGNWSLKLGKREKDAPTAFEISSLRWRYFSKEIEGNYPNYRQVVPSASACQTTLVFEPAGMSEIIQTIERMPCHDDVNHTIALQVQNRRVSLVSRAAGAENPTTVEIQAVKAIGKDILIAFNRQFLVKALSFGLNTVHLIDGMTPGRFSNAGRQLIVMPIRPDAGPQEKAPVKEPTATVDSKPQTAPAPSAETGASTKERNEDMRNASTAAPVTNGSSTNGHTEPALTITSALEQIEKVKGSYREAIQGLNLLAETLKSVQREQKASEKEVQSVRTTLEKLQSVRL